MRLNSTLPPPRRQAGLGPAAAVAPLSSGSCRGAPGNPRENTAWSARDPLPGDPAARPAGPSSPATRAAPLLRGAERRVTGGRERGSSGPAAAPHDVPRTRGAGPGRASPPAERVFAAGGGVVGVTHRRGPARGPSPRGDASVPPKHARSVCRAPGADSDTRRYRAGRTLSIRAVI